MKRNKSSYRRCPDMLIYRPDGSWRRGCTDGQGMSGSRAPRISGRHESIREGGGASIRCVSDARPPWKRCRMEAEGGGKTGWPGAQVGTKETQSGRALPDAVAGQVPPFWLRRYPARVSDVPRRTWGGAKAGWPSGLNRATTGRSASVLSGGHACWTRRLQPWSCTEDSAAGPTAGFPGAGEGATSGQSQAILGNKSAGGIPPLGMASLWFWRGCADGHLGWWRWGVKGVQGIRGSGGGETKYRQLKLRLGTHGFP